MKITRYPLRDMSTLGRHPFPQELFVVCALAPPLVEYMFRTKQCTAVESAYAASAAAIPMLAIPLVIHAAYRWGVPKIVPPAWRSSRRLVLHLPLVALLGVATALFVVPLVRLIHPLTVANLPRFLVIAMVISIGLFVPGLLLQEVRRMREQAELDARREQKVRLEAQLAALQARTSPHFLFNALNTVASLVHDDPDLAEATLERLSSLFRYALEGSRATSVPLKRELAMCEDYLEIQSARFGERFTWQIDVDARAHSVAVSPMMLQPLVENAVVHGVSRRQREGRVGVTIRIENSTLVCVVTDNGPGLEGPSKGKSDGTRTSLEDLRARLSMLPQGGGALTVEELQDGGFRSQVVMPLGAVGS